MLPSRCLVRCFTPEREAAPVFLFGREKNGEMFRNVRTLTPTFPHLQYRYTHIHVHVHNDNTPTTTSVRPPVARLSAPLEGGFLRDKTRRNTRLLSGRASPGKCDPGKISSKNLSSSRRHSLFRVRARARVYLYTCLSMCMRMSTPSVHPSLSASFFFLQRREHAKHYFRECDFDSRHPVYDGKENQ